MGLVAPRHVGYSRTRDRTCVPCIGRRILNHCATREVPPLFLLISFLLLSPSFPFETPSMHRLFLLMIPHKSHRFSSFFFLFSFCSSDWIISKYLCSSFTISFFCLVQSGVEAIYWILWFSHCILQHQNFCLVHLHVSIPLLNFSFCSCIGFLILLNCLCVFACCSLSVFRTIILNFLSGN